MTVSQRFGLNPTTIAPAKTATAPKILRNTFAGYAAVIREARMGGVTGVVVFAVILFVLVIGLFIFVSRR